MKLLGTRVVLCVALGLGVGATGCQPLYGDKPDKLRNPEKKRRPPDQPETAAEVKYIDDCTVSFTDDPKKWHPQQSMAQAADQLGDTALASADKATDGNSKVGFIKDAIDKYRAALLKDPYDPHATLQLAVAYDRVLRKGCALALLKRLATLTNNPKVAPHAADVIQDVSNNGTWFKGYRKDAMSAAGL